MSPGAAARLFLAVAIAVAALASPARADESADELFARAVKHYKAEQYAEAAKLFARVYELKPSIDVGFAWAQSERFSDNCPKALELLDELLGKKLSRANRKAIREAQSQCEARVAELEAKKAAELEAQKKAEAAAAAAAAREAEADSADREPVSPETEAEAEPQRVASADPQPAPAIAPPVDRGPRDGGGAWYTDPVGGALVGAGVVGIGVGIGFYMSGRSADRDAGSTDSYSEFLELTDRAESRGRLGVIGMAAGGALVAGGVLWYVLGGGGGADEPAVSGWVDPRGGGVGFATRF